MTEAERTDCSTDNCPEKANRMLVWPCGDVHPVCETCALLITGYAERETMWARCATHGVNLNLREVVIEPLSNWAQVPLPPDPGDLDIWGVR